MKIFNTVTDLALATLSSNQLVQTKGLVSPGDGGQAIYLIRIYWYSTI